MNQLFWLVRFFTSEKRNHKKERKRNNNNNKWGWMEGRRLLARFVHPSICSLTLKIIFRDYSSYEISKSYSSSFILASYREESSGPINQETFLKWIQQYLNTKSLRSEVFTRIPSDALYSFIFPQKVDCTYWKTNAQVSFIPQLEQTRKIIRKKETASQFTSSIVCS